MIIEIRSSSPRYRPKAGDRRTTKAHGEQIRIPKIATCGAYVVSGGRQLYEWVSVDCVPDRFKYLLKRVES